MIHLARFQEYWSRGKKMVIPHYKKIQERIANIVGEYRYKSIIQV